MKKNCRKNTLWSFPCIIGKLIILALLPVIAACSSRNVKDDIKTEQLNEEIGALIDGKIGLYFVHVIVDNQTGVIRMGKN